MYSKCLNKKFVTSISATVLCLSSIVATEAATLGERAVYNMKIIVAGDATEVGFCSAFAFGDATATCTAGTGVGPFVDNVDTAISLSGGDGIAGDGFAGVITIETAKADGTGSNTFNIVSFSVDPYLDTAGGTFKTSMSPPDGANNGSGTLTAAGDMTLDVTGRVGIAGNFPVILGIQPWNIHDTTASTAIPITNLYESFTTGTDFNHKIGFGAGQVNLTLAGRPIGDANTDNILDAILVSVGNVGKAWGSFDGTPYSEVFNVQFELVSAKPVANPDVLPTSNTVSAVFDVATFLLSNDTHAEGDDLTLTPITVSTTAEAANGSTITVNTNGTVTYVPPSSGGATSDSFSYTVTDEDSNTDTTTVTLLFPTSPAGSAADDNPAAFDEDTSLLLDPTANDTDPNGGALVLFDFQGITTQNGQVVAAGGNSVTYTPPADFFGDDSFTYRVLDTNNNLLTATVNLTVNPVNDPLVCLDVGLAVGTDRDLSINVSTKLLSTCTDLANEANTITFVSAQPSTTANGGTINDNGAGSLTYTPATGFNGTDTFTYTASDGFDTDIRTVTVTVGNFGNFTMLKPFDSGAGVFGGTNDVEFAWDGVTFNTNEADTNFGIMTIASKGPQPFFGSAWTAHHVRVYGQGTYTFDTTCTVQQLETGVTLCNNPLDIKNLQTVRDLVMVVGAGQVGAHMLFNWSTSTNIDVINVWNRNDVWADPDGTASLKNNLWQGAAGLAPALDANWELVSTDANGDSVNGSPMIDGPFNGYYANFNSKPDKTATCDDGTDPPCTVVVQADDTPLGNGSLNWLTLIGLVPLISLLRSRKNK